MGRSETDNGDIGSIDRSIVVSARVPSGEYGTAVIITLFVSAFLSYIQLFTFSIALAALAVPVLVYCWSADRLEFDGKRLRRTGPIYRGWAYLTSARTSFSINRIEQVATIATSTFRRGGRVLYRYRTIVRFRNQVFVVASSTKGYLDFVNAFLPRLPAEVLDHQTIEIRDYLRNPRSVLADAKRAGIPAADVLEGLFRRDYRSSKRRIRPNDTQKHHIDPRGAGALLRLANELKVSGRLVQALEAFRRAISCAPADSRALFDISNCLRILASLKREPKLEHRATALMRLAEQQLGNDSDLLVSLAETYLKIGEWRRAELAFRRVIDRFGASARVLSGLAELALSEGKMAHVVLNLEAASQLADSSAVRRKTRVELAYFQRLNRDVEYLELELARIRLLDALENTRRSGMRITIFGFGVIALGLGMGESLVADLGWAVSALSSLVWILSAVGARSFRSRIPLDQLSENQI